MFSSFFKKNSPETPQDVKGIREALLQFIKQQLQKWEGGEGGLLRAMYLYVTAPEAGRHLYESAFYSDDENRFREAVQKIADDFALNLPNDWLLHISYTDAPPAGAVFVPNLPVALLVSGGQKKPVSGSTQRATLRVLNGEAEQASYAISAEEGRINLGREQKVQTANGFYRENKIAFPAHSGHEGNRYISRQHAHIEWDEEVGAFLLFADEGGLPPRNKVKVRTTGGVLVKLQTAEIGHPLRDGDQIILGETALLEFRNEG